MIHHVKQAVGKLCPAGYRRVVGWRWSLAAGWNACARRMKTAGMEMVFALLGRVISPRDDTVLLASMNGLAGNLARMLQVLAEADWAGRLVVAVPASSVAETREGLSPAESRKVTVMAQGSPAVFRAILRSGFIVVTHDALRDTGFPVPRHRRRRIVNVWHGIGMKRHWLLTDRDRRAFQWQLREARRFDVVIASSKADAQHNAAIFRKADSQMRLTGLPRNDWLVSGPSSYTGPMKRQHAECLRQKAGRRLVLYAPTFRAYYAADSRPDSIRLSPILAGESGALIDLLARQNAVLGVRLHHYDQRQADGILNPAILNCGHAEYPEVAALLAETDLLISDYSSVWVDYLLTGKPVIAFQYDRDVYDHKRGIVWDERCIFPGPVVESMDQLNREIERLLTTGMTEKERWHYELSRRFFHEFDDGRAGERVAAVMQDLRKT